MLQFKQMLTVGNIVKLHRKYSAKFYYISTDYVFAIKVVIIRRTQKVVYDLMIPWPLCKQFDHSINIMYKHIMFVWLITPGLHKSIGH